MLTEQDVQEIMLKTGKSRNQIEIKLNKEDYLGVVATSVQVLKKEKPSIKKIIGRKKNG